MKNIWNESAINMLWRVGGMGCVALCENCNTIKKKKGVHRKLKRNIILFQYWSAYRIGRAEKIVRDIFCMVNKQLNKHMKLWFNPWLESGKKKCGEKNMHKVQHIKTLLLTVTFLF